MSKPRTLKSLIEARKPNAVPKNLDATLSYYPPYDFRSKQGLEQFFQQVMNQTQSYEAAWELVDYLKTKQSDPNWKWPRSAHNGGRDPETVARAEEEDVGSARTSGSGRPFEGKITLKSLLGEGYFPDTAQVQPGDKVDVYLPDSFMTQQSAVRVVELVDNVFDATGVEPAVDSNVEDSIDFDGPGFVGEFDEDSGEAGQLVFSLHQVVPGSKEKYESLMDDDPYMNQKNYDRETYEGDPSTVSDYYDEDGARVPVPFRAYPVENKSLETESFDKFMDKIVIQESHNANRKMIVEDSAMRIRAARHQERPAGRTRWSKSK